jgi:small subunit ribosomal protein S2
MSNVTVKQLIANKSHFGHKPSKLHPLMRTFVWEKAGKISIINLAKTVAQLNKACGVVEKVLAEGGQILWVGTKTPARESIKRVSDSLESPYVIHRWIGGTLTNTNQVRKAVTKLLHSRDIVEKPLEHLKKKEIVMLKKELGRLEKNVNGIVCLREKPSLLVIVDAKKELTSILEAKKEGIPVIGLVDTDTDPALVDLVIPCNDDSVESIDYVLTVLEESARLGFDAFKKEEAEKEKKAAEQKAKAAAVKQASDKTKKEEKDRAFKAASIKKEVSLSKGEATPAKKSNVYASEKSASQEVEKKSLAVSKSTVKKTVVAARDKKTESKSVKSEVFKKPEQAAIVASKATVSSDEKKEAVEKIETPKSKVVAKK